MDPVVIVGGGIGGPTAAIALQRAGTSVTVLEQAPELTEVGAGIGLWPNAVKALDGLGVDVRPLGVPLTASGVRRPDGAWLQHQDPDRLERRFGAPFIGVHRADLQQLLARHVRPGTVTLGAHVTGIEQDPSGVAVRLDDGSDVTGSVVVGADGIRSTVRSRLLADGAPRYLGYTSCRSSAATAPTGVVRAGGPSAAALREYEARRRRRAVRIVAASRWAGRSGQLDGRWSGGLRDAVVRATPPAVALRQLDPLLGRAAPEVVGATLPA